MKFFEKRDRRGVACNPEQATFKIRKRKKMDISTKEIPGSKNESPHKKNINKKSVKSISKKNKNISENSEKNG